MSSLIPFSFESKSFRVLNLDGAPWFCLVDACVALDVERSSSLVKGLDKGGWVSNLTPTISGIQPMIFINEPNLYRLIFRSDKPEARRFQDWVFTDVLPAIRQTGEYRTLSSAAPSTDLPRLRAQRDALWAWLIELKPEVGKIARYRQAGLTQQEVARALAWGVKRVRQAERRLDTAGLLPKRESMQLSLLEG